MRLPNLLATTRGRLTAFFLLYVTEGLPLGFAATAVATQLRRQGVGPAEIGAFVGAFYLPWAFKWAFGPVVDVFASERLGRRRGWILGTQVMMALTLLSTVLLDLPAQLGLFTVILLVHNSFAAMQDVAIDALAVNTLQEHERGLANGLMFAGANVGQMVGGAGVLFLGGYTGFQATFFFVAGCLLLVTVLVVLPLREPTGAARIAVVGSRLGAAGREMRGFAIRSFRSFLGSRGAFSALFYALLPPGAMCLGLALQSNLAVELGMDDDQIAWLNVWSTLINGSFCVLGGLLSDRFGRRRMLFLYIACMGLPVLYLAHLLSRYGWVMPADAASRPVVPPALLMAFWVATLAYNAINGLMYGTNSAAYMDVTNPAVAATQFTAYMALMNLSISYSAVWQGIAIEAWGYPRTMLADALFGLLCLALIPLMRKRPEGRNGADGTDGIAAPRARRLAFGLGLMCIGWLPYAAWQDAAGAARPIFGILFTLVFVGAAVFLLAGATVLRQAAPRLARLGLCAAPLLLLMHARRYVDDIGGWFAIGAPTERFKLVAALVFGGMALAGGVVLLLFARQPWHALGAATDATADAAMAPA